MLDLFQIDQENLLRVVRLVNLLHLVKHDLVQTLV
jgi:hypothetical protein